MAAKRTPNFLKGLKKGALRKQLGISAKKTIPVSTLRKCAKSSDKTLARRCQFALNARKFKKPKKK